MFGRGKGLLGRLNDEDVYLIGGVWCAGFLIEELKREGGAYFTPVEKLFSGAGDFGDWLANAMLVIPNMGMLVMWLIFSVLAILKEDPDKRKMWTVIMFTAHLVLGPVTGVIVGLLPDAFNRWLGDLLAPLGGFFFLLWGKSKGH